MYKYVYLVVILALLFTAPLSFTGDQCPDFKPDVELHETTPPKKTLAAHCKAIAVAAALLADYTETVATYVAPAQNTPANITLSSSLHGRASPQI